MGFFRSKPHEGWERAMATVLEAEQTRLSLTRGPLGNTRIGWDLRLRIEPQGRAPLEVDGRAMLDQGTSPYPGMRLAVRFDPVDPARWEPDESAEATITYVEDEIARQGIELPGGLDLPALMRQQMTDPAGAQEAIAKWQAEQMANATRQMAAGQELIAQAQAEAEKIRWDYEEDQAARTPNIAGQLRDLAELHASGALSDDEFAAAKRRLLRDA